MRSLNLAIWAAVALWAVAATSSLAQGDDPSAWARAGWEAGKRSGTVWGYPDGTYHPRAYATREEAQAFAHAEASRQAASQLPALMPVPQGGSGRMNIDAGTILATLGILFALGFMVLVVYALLRNGNPALGAAQAMLNGVEGPFRVSVTPDGGLSLAAAGHWPRLANQQDGQPAAAPVVLPATPAQAAPPAAAPPPRPAVAVVAAQPAGQPPAAAAAGNQ